MKVTLNQCEGDFKEFLVGGKSKIYNRMSIDRIQRSSFTTLNKLCMFVINGKVSP